MSSIAIVRQYMFIILIIWRKRKKAQRALLLGIGSLFRRGCS